MRVVLAMAGEAIHRQRGLGDVLGDVAGLATETAVSTGQRVSRLRVVVIAPAFPAVRVVAKRTVRPHAPFVMNVAVASTAAKRRALELLRMMAFFASHDGVSADQRKSGDVVIEGRYPAPAGLSVTLLATISKLAFMSVILLVTRHTGRRQFVAIEIPRMAAIALDLRMPAFQRIFRHLVMIEVNYLPLVLIVAAFAFSAISSGVGVLNFVTVQAQGSDALVALALMANCAGDVAVSALERKFGRAVVERLHLPPRNFAVAIVAFFAKAPLVWILLLMTVEAATGGLPEFYRWRVTAGARHRLVRIPKKEICEGVIERLAIKLDDVGITSLMICMTMVAFLFRIRLASMKAPARRAIHRNFLVAVQAAPRLGFPREGLVTIAALLLQLCMSFDDRPRHDKLFKQGLRLHG
jgi:hypothetical protein